MFSGQDVSRKTREWFSWSLAKDTYRPDIDGLRALAVISVIWFHAFPATLPGGFVGVDIFFVISGFLISTILFREMETGTYRYDRFMGRRIRRIFPALCAVLAATFIGGWALLSQNELIALGKEIAAGSLFFANILFWSQNGYFDVASEFKPLLHLWSLGIEEQFYIFYPPLLWLIFKLRWKLGGILTAILLTSFVWGVQTTDSASSFAFFMLPARLWELLCGALVAVVLTRNEPPLLLRQSLKPWLSNISSFVGLALIVFAISLTKKINFPGYWAPLPTVGASLFILAGPKAFPNRFLFSFRPIVAIGLISYPLYLWHWPLISFEHILAGARPATGYLKIAVWLSLGLSIGTYFFIEKPVRRFSMQKTYKFLSPLVVITAAIGFMIVIKQGFPRRTAEELIAAKGQIDHSTFHEYGNEHFIPCEARELRENALLFDGKTLRCHQSRPGTAYDIVLLGDSHAEQIFYGLAAQLPEKNIVYAINYGLPITGNGRLEKAYQYFLSKTSEGKMVDVILAGAWALHFGDANVEDGLGTLVTSFQKAGHRVFVTDDIPNFPFEPSLCKINRRLSLSPRKCTEESQGMQDSRSRIRQEIEAVAAKSGAQILYTHDFFRQGNQYFMAKEGFILYRDNNHLNINGSLFLAKNLRMTGQLKFFMGNRSGTEEAIHGMRGPMH